MKYRNIFMLLLFFNCFSLGSPAVIDYDILIRNGMVFDGSFKQAFRADVAIKDGRIVKVAKSIKGKAKNVIDAHGLYVSPGFIDIHTHVDSGMNFPDNKACLNYLKQGVTTVVVGHCGRSAWPLFEEMDDQVKRWSNEGIGPNAALLVGHGQVRETIMGMENRKPSSEELEKMKALVKQAMDQGAYGISTGLEYIPGSFGKTDEIIALVKVVAPYGGIYHTHMRDEGDKLMLLEAVKETIEIARTTGVPTHISHLKASGKKSWGQIKEACALIEQAQRQNIKITADQYPFRFGGNSPYKPLIPSSAWLGEKNQDLINSSDIEKIFDHLSDTHLIELYLKTTSFFSVTKQQEQYLKNLPRKRLVELVSRNLISLSDFHGPGNERGRTLFLIRMADPIEAEKIRQQVVDYIDENSGPENCYIVLCPKKDFERKTLKEVAGITGKSIADTAIELGLMGTRCITKKYSEEDVEYIMKKDYVATGSDGITPFFGNGLYHIRSYSTFLHKIKKYVLERKTISLPHAIRSQTSLPASIMKFKDRGWIRDGYKADLVILDLKNINNNASISNPHQYSEGVEYLFINGQIIIKKGKFTGKLSGKILPLEN